jgi:type II secretory pathway pseudopilin PulG
MSKSKNDCAHFKMNIINFYLKTKQKSSENAGFTLVENIMATTMTLILISAIGYSLANILQTKKTSQIEISRRIEINRALNFIADEIKHSEKIETNISDANLATIAPNFTRPSDAQVILALKLPNLNNRTIYYVKNQPINSSWLGPKTIYRWGPNLADNGTYTNTVWQAQPLVDRIDNNNFTPNCNSNETTVGGTGFAACIDNSTKMSKIYMRGQLQNKIYQGEIKAYSRINDPPPLVASGNINLASVGVINTVPNCSISNGTLNCTSPTKLTFQNLGGALTCGAGGKSLNVDTELQFVYSDGTTDKKNLNRGNIDSNGNTINPGNPLEETPDPNRSITQVVVKSTATSGGWCSNYTYNTTSTNTSQVKALRNGDPVPNITPFANQATIDTFLQGYVENGKIKLANNQIIYLFELGTTNQSSTAFDLQDNVVLVTMSSPNS